MPRTKIHCPCGTTLTASLRDPRVNCPCGRAFNGLTGATIDYSHLFDEEELLDRFYDDQGEPEDYLDEAA